MDYWGWQLNIDINNPQPGVYENVPEADYHAIKAMNWSSLKRGIDENMHAVKDSLDGQGQDETSAQSFGTKAHMALFEREKYDALTVTDKYKTTTKEGMITKKEKDRIDRQTFSLFRCMNHQIDIFNGQNELVIIWQEEIGEEKIICKARVDNYTKPYGNDLKTTAKRNSESFLSSAAYYHYDGQASFYRRGLLASGMPVNGFNFWISQKDSPFTAGHVAVDDYVMNMWDHIIDALLQQWIEFLQNPTPNHWQAQMPEPSMNVLEKVGI